MKQSVKRRDSKHRILRTGESQRKDGRYVFKYLDEYGAPQFVYSWKLEPTDKLPAGKKPDRSLREKEKDILRNQLDGLASRGGDMTVLELVDRYLQTKVGVKPTTEAGYQTVRNILAKEAFSTYRIDRVKLSDAKLFLIKLQKENGRSYSSIHTIRGVLRPAFQMAVDDDLLRKNPFDFELAKVIVDDSVTREAVSREDERRFLEFVRQDAHYSRYYDAFYILFKTGMRISEFCGLTIRDIDLNAKTVRIDHQLQKKADGTLYISTPKTEHGIRVLPLTDDVLVCFRRILQSRQAPEIEPIVDGYAGFLFFTKDGAPRNAMHWEKFFSFAVAKHNRIYRVQLPKITPHVCRHTYCSNMAKSGMNPKTLQYLMGHSDISITMNTYTHLGLQDAWEELHRLESLKNQPKQRKNDA